MQINPEEVRSTIAKNLHPSYGLTLVAGLPLPSRIYQVLEQVQVQIESTFAGRFSWYQPAQMHVTLSALLRGRYRQSPPLERNELPSDINSFFREFIDFLAIQAPLQIKWDKYHLTPNGLLVCRAQCNEFSNDLIELLRKYPELNPPPKKPDILHLTIGYLNFPEPFKDPSEVQLLNKTVSGLREYEIETYLVDQVWLVHYANRTFNLILGKVPLSLGKRESLKSNTILQRLQIK